MTIAIMTIIMIMMMITIITRQNGQFWARCSALHNAQFCWSEIFCIFHREIPSSCIFPGPPCQSNGKRTSSQLKKMWTPCLLAGPGGHIKMSTIIRWQLLSRTHHMSPARGWKWKWSNGAGPRGHIKASTIITIWKFTSWPSSSADGVILRLFLPMLFSNYLYFMNYCWQMNILFLIIIICWSTYLAMPFPPVFRSFFPAIRTPPWHISHHHIWF